MPQLPLHSSGSVPFFASGFQAVSACYGVIRGNWAESEFGHVDYGKIEDPGATTGRSAWSVDTVVKCVDVDSVGMQNCRDGSIEFRVQNPAILSQ